MSVCVRLSVLEWNGLCSFRQFRNQQSSNRNETAFRNTILAHQAPQYIQVQGYCDNAYISDKHPRAEERVTYLYSWFHHGSRAAYVWVRVCVCVCVWTICSHTSRCAPSVASGRGFYSPSVRGSRYAKKWHSKRDINLLRLPPSSARTINTPSSLAVDVGGCY